MEAAIAAGRIALGYFRQDPDTWYKDNNSPVSVADMEVDGYLSKTLHAERPQYGWLSEETMDDHNRLERQRCFIVDPIDGTRVFLAGGEDWTVALAVVEAGRPTVGVVYNPVRDQLYSAIAGRGAKVNGTPLTVSLTKSVSGASIVAPHRIAKQRELAAHGLVPAPYIGSLAYRIARVADGNLDVMCATKSPSDWDLAAADLLLEEAGGKLTDLSGQTLRYNKLQTRHPALVGAPESLLTEARDILKPFLSDPR
ncbi:MAG: 3'(2'),5'-bisphosphate nucleotidase CysQ [Rhodobacteraceae bacterium]|nr:3'(2'),5'-bisphosphate nucleotidase CysQ [Paracoccaceae bacterium]